MELDIHQYLTKAKEQQDVGALRSAYHLIKDVTAAGTTGRHVRIVPEVYVMCAEAALQLGCSEISSECLKMYFEGNPLANQFLCRAYLCQGQLKSPPATGSVKEFEEAVMCFLKAIEISKHEPRHLIKCLLDSGKKEDAAIFAKDTEEFVNSHAPHLYPRLFTLMVQHKLSESDVLNDMSRQCTTLAVIYKLQEFKNRLKKINENELTKEDSVKLEEIFHLLVDCTSVVATPTASSPLQIPVQPADRVDFLLELALLALQVKHQKVAIDCLKELKSMPETSVGQRLIMECVNCEINLLKKGAKMDDYSKASVEARLKEIGKLDQWLQTAVRENVPQAVQALCTTQWSFCLPLLQHNLRKRVKAPLLRVVQVMEDIHSMLLEMRSQIHSELAAIEEEEGRLEASLIHLQKAMLLDNGSQRERLSTAFHLLQLRGTLYQTPSRNEDKAAMLMQQARDVQPQDKTDSRPILIAVGLLLTPDDFQMVLDADNPSKKCRCSGEESCAQCLHGCTESQSSVRDLLRLLAEIRFINAEATVQKLLTEGLQLNSPAVPPQGAGAYVSDEDPHWVIYRDWIQALSVYATSNFLRAAELGIEIREMWVVANAAIYLWNYNSHLLATGEYQHIVPTFQRLVEMLRNREFTQNRVLVMLLCDAVARALIQPLCGADNIESAPPADKGKNRAEKRTVKSAGVHGVPSDAAVLQDMSKALELCDYALQISNCNNPGESVPIAARKQVLATWVQIKRLLQQQIGSKAELVSMASECSWSDAVVELQVWCQLAAFCHDATDHSLVLYCTKNALQLEEAAAKSLNTMPCVLYGTTAVNEMLSSAACLNGLSLVHESNGDLHAYKEAMRVLLSGVSYAEKAKSPPLCIAAAKHYWNTCLPLTQIPVERLKLQEPLEKILTALINTSAKNANKQGKGKSQLTLTAMPSRNSKRETKDEKDLAITAAIYSFLLQIYIDRKDWKSTMQLLDKAIREMHCTRHRVNLLKQRILVKVHLGESIVMDMQKLQEEDEQCYSFMWHQVALCAGNTSQQLTSYQKSITSVLCAEKPWQQVSLLLEFGAWLYCHNFPKADAQHQVQWAIDLLLHMEPESTGETEDESKKKDLSSVVGVQGLLCTQSVSNLRDVWRLDCLIQAHTLLAFMTDRTLPEHQLNLLRAYTFVLQMWQVSLAGVRDIFSDLGKSQPSQPSPSAASKKDKDKNKGKKVKEKAMVVITLQQNINSLSHRFDQPTPSEERPKPVVFDHALPSSPTDWAYYTCPDQARQIFRTNSNPYTINKHSITQSLFYLDLLEKELLSLSLDHLTLPVLHLAETIAHDVLDQKSLSDLYRLRCQKTIALLLERRNLHKTSNQNANAGSGQQNVDVCVQDTWLDKAEVCLSLGLYQAARQILAQAHLILTELGDHKATARCLLSLATLACEEHNYSQALILLDKAQALGGDEEFWYNFTLTRVRTVVGQEHQDAQTKVDQFIKQGCGALKLVLEQQVNRVSKLKFLIVSLEMRGAMECIGAIGCGEPGDTLCTEAVHRLTAACDTLRDCASAFAKLGYRAEAAEAHVESAHGLRILANKSTDADEKQSCLLCGFSQMQLAVALQEDIVLNAQNLLPPQEESHGLSLAAKRRLRRMQLALAEYCLVMLEKYCTEEKAQAVARARKTSLEVALEEFTCSTPEPNSTKQEWLSVGRTLGQVALSQLAAVQPHCLVNMETKAHCMSLMGKYLRLLAVHEDPIYLSTLWDRHKQKEACSNPKVISEEKEISEKEKQRESSRKKPRMTSAKHAEMQHRRLKAQQLLAQASKALAEAIGLCLQHNLSPSILAEACLNMLECYGQSDSTVAVLSPDEPGKHVVLLADRKLLELPLESLSMLQEEGLFSVSRDFSLQLFHSRLNREEPEKVERDNKKETKGGKGTKGKEDQSPAIKAHTLSKHTDIMHMSLYRKSEKKEDNLADTCCVRHKHQVFTLTGPVQVLVQHKILFLSSYINGLCESTSESFFDSDMTHFLSILKNCIYPVLSLECRMALLFDRVQNDASILCQSSLHTNKSAGQFALDEPLETALLLSLGGVSCVVLNQWHSSLQQNTHNMATFLDHPVLLTDSKEHDVDHKITYLAFNCILYGLPNLIVT
ncbi:Cilia- and flagella-associated protein 46 [Channa argus]|uniref:Cilia-and flagella-associated protein 46 n=1 Tax=Channa argus TaxID=215402 RepID=A0A6G1R103_CHAAH|nr:Cilia- and flagella-associated protein 46 [Channa argus]